MYQVGSYKALKIGNIGKDGTAIFIVGVLPTLCFKLSSFQLNSVMRLPINSQLDDSVAFWWHLKKFDTSNLV